MREVHCPNCGRRLSVPDEAAARDSRCPGCGEVFVPFPTHPPAPVETPIEDISLPPRPDGSQHSSAGFGRREWWIVVMLAVLLLFPCGCAMCAAQGMLDHLGHFAVAILAGSLLILFIRACSNADRPTDADD